MYNTKKILVVAVLMVIGTTLLDASEIHEAANDNDIKRIKTLLKEDPSLLNARDDEGMTALNIAAFNGNTEIVNELLERGADLSIGDIDGSQPIHCAAINGSIEVVELLRKKGASINDKDDNGATPLSFATGRRHIDLLRYLIENGADLNARDIDGMTALFLASTQEIAELLVGNGANINIQSRSRITPLHSAVWRGWTEVVRFLLKKGADPNKQNDAGLAPLHWANGDNCIQIARLLIENGARVDIQSHNNTTPLHMIAGFGSVETAELLLAYGADINAINDFGWTPLSNAAFCNTEITRYLISQGADVNPHKTEQKKASACHAGYQTPLHCAVRRDSLNTVKLLIENGAVINATDGDMLTPLHIAVRNGNSEMTEYLISKDALLNLKDNHWGQSELHTAAIHGHKNIADLLVKKGADINVLDNEGKAPLDYASYHGFDSITSFLLANGAIKKSETTSTSTSMRLNKGLKDKEAIIWHLGHSGWAIKTQNHLLIFDYFTDTNRPLPTDASLASGYIVPDDIKDENVAVFVTHHHGDHYDPAIFEWQSGVSKIQYVLGFTDRQSDNEYILVGPRTERMLDDMKVSTIKANDAGVGFLVEVDGLVIFHAGDHANGFMDMSGTYTPEIDALTSAKPKIDLAFFPIIGCSLGTPESVQLGVHYAIEKIKPTIVMPMHAGNATYRYKEFAEEVAAKGYETQIAYASNKGDRFLFADSKITKIE
jgi:ankyrin repeat protein/L-ascorbate metabolism protein UlaG (beta-lactamase superfamily)